VLIGSFDCSTDVEALELLRSALHRLRPMHSEGYSEARSLITGGLTKLIRVLASEPRALYPRSPVIPRNGMHPFLRVPGARQAAEAAFRTPHPHPGP
jgi:hypothetical protein